MGAERSSLVRPGECGSERTAPTAVPTAAPTTAQDAVPPAPSLAPGTAALKPKRPHRERKKKERFALLHSMNVEERRQFLLDEATQKEEAVRKLRQAAAPDSASQRVAIDLSFEAMMNPKELRSLVKQLQLVYSTVKKMREPLQLVLCDPSEAVQHALENVGANNWLVRWCHGPDGLTRTFSPSDIVYLSPDSPHVLETVDPSKTYVIGGIVDKSRKKGATLSAAAKKGVSTARLPIQEHVAERPDHILNVNTVLEVLLRFQELGDWPRALKAALPKRKQSQSGRRARLRRDKQQVAGSSTQERGATTDGIKVEDDAAPQDEPASREAHDPGFEAPEQA